MKKMTISAAVRQACNDVLENAQDKKVTRALELLGIEHEKAYNFGLAHFDTKSISKSVRRFFDVNPVGRPEEMSGGRKIHAYLDTESIAIATRLGNGNVSEGIRKALKQAAE